MSVKTAVIGAEFHSFWVGVEDWTQFQYDFQGRGIVGLLMEPEPCRGGALVNTKVHSGLVGVELEYHETRPALDLDGWEDADLLIVDCPKADLWVIPQGGWGEAIDGIVPGPGTYTVCCRSRGRDAADEDESVNPPVEHYRFDVWPTQPGDTTRTLKQTSLAGAPPMGQ
ncbi:MAG: hypothetical protein LCH96_10990 [Actinobacteria bacterium]|nr:hypothetical protein [Actinomycetota bacterium]